MSIERMAIHISTYTIQFQKKSPGGDDIHRKTPAMESFLEKLLPFNIRPFLLKSDSNIVISFLLFFSEHLFY